MQHAIRSVDTLVERGLLTPQLATQLARVTARYPLCITPYYLQLAQGAFPDDPVLTQCLPDLRELVHDAVADPFAEEGSTGVPGLIQRYPDRVLVVVASQCAVACRHCTRKNLLGRRSHVVPDGAWDAVCRAIQERPAVREVIVSGGDPLLLDTEVLRGMLRDLHAIAHVEVVRIGTRVPVVLPMRIDAALADMLAEQRPLWVNTQFNHPVEVTEQSLNACEALIGRGIPVSNQTVLLRGVNDDVDTLANLCNSLQRNMIRPYYVFQCDPVMGTNHFRTDIEHGVALSRALRGRLGGLAMPQFVADLPGAHGKVPLETVTTEGGW